MSTAIEAEQYVADSAKVLDAEIPGWWRTLDTGHAFGVHDPSNCPLQQLYGGYTEGFNLLAESEYDSIDDLGGFYCTAEQEPDYVASWRHEVARRQREDEVFSALHLLPSELLAGVGS